MRVKLILLFVLAFLISCNNNDDFVSLDKIIILEVLDGENQIASNILADGVSLVVLKATIPNNADQSINTIIFKKSNGDFLGIEGAQTTRTVDEDGNAFISVKVPNEVERLFFSAQVSANNTNYIREKNIDLKRAYPEEIIIEPASVSITAGNSLAIDIFLLRDIGKVSFETAAEFSSFQVDNATGVKTKVGRFTGLTNKTNVDGKITVTFHSDTGDIDTSRPVEIIVKSRNDLEEIIESRIKIKIN